MLAVSVGTFKIFNVIIVMGLMLVEDRNSLDHIDKDNGGITVVCD